MASKELIDSIRTRAASLRNGHRGDAQVMSEQISDMSLLLLEVATCGCGRRCSFSWPMAAAVIGAVSITVAGLVAIFGGG